MALASFFRNMFHLNPGWQQLAVRILLTLPIAYLPIRLSDAPEAVSLFWYTNVWIIALVVQLPYRKWIPVLAAAITCSFIGCMLGGQQLQVALLYVPMNTLHTLAMAYAIRNLAVWPDVGASPGHLVRLLLLGVVVPTLIVGLFGAFILASSPADFLPTYYRLFTGSTITAVGALPFLAAVACEVQADEKPSWLNRRTLAAAIMVSFAVFFVFASVSNPFISTAIILLAPAVALSFAGLALCILLVTATAAFALFFDIYNFPSVGVELHFELRGISLPLACLPALLVSVYVQSNRRNLRQLDHARRDLQQALDALPSMVAYWDKDLVNRFANRAYVDRFGGKTEGVTGRRIHDVLGDELFLKHQASIEEVLREGKYQEFETVLDDERLGPRQSLVSYVPDIVNDEVAGFYVLIHDVTKIKETERELKRALVEADEARRLAEEASRAKSHFVANMSHEIRTPLNAVIGISQLLQDTSLDERQQAYLSKISSSSKALLHVINDILDFAKVESGQMTFEKTIFNLESTIETVTDLFVLPASEKGVELLIDIPVDVSGDYISDPFRLAQVLTNFVGNAVKFTAQGEVCLKVERLAINGNFAKLKFSVRDTGIGIQPGEINRLFSAFIQADSTTTRRYGGTGLGLAIARRIVHLMGGEIEVQSEPGKGSTFSFTVDLECAGPCRFDVKHIEFLADYRVLVVDDNETVRDILADLLKMWNIETFTAKSGDEALDIMQAQAEAGQDIHAMLLDWRMADMDGGLVVGHLREMQVPINATVIAMITEADRQDILEVLGSSDLIPILLKPITPSKLLRVLLAAKKNIVEPDPSGSEYSRQLALGAVKLSGRHMLLVEDNGLNRTVACELLSKLGVTMDIAENGKQAVVLAGKNRYDAILMDLQMPEMDGFEATRQIRELFSPDDLPIIAMTAAVGKEDRQATLEAGMNAHVPKPIDLNELISVLVDLTDKKPGETLPDNFEFPQAGAKLTDEEEEKLIELAAAGINVREIVGRYAGDSRLLISTLRIFAQSFSTFEEELDIALAARDLATLQRTVHTLKGAAGNVGAEEIWRLAEAYETDLKTGIQKPGNSLLPALKRLLAVIHRLLPPESISDEPANIDMSQFSLEKFTELGMYLRRSQVVPPHLVEWLRGLQKVDRLQCPVEDLLRLMNNYNYAQAFVRLEQIQSEFFASDRE